MSSPIAVVHRRKAQYKCRTPGARRLRPGNTLPQQDPNTSPADKSVLRDRFQALCSKRTRRVPKFPMHGRKPALSDGSDFGMGDDEMDWGEEETDDDIMQDELFRRIMQNMQHRRTHAYQLSYSQEVGSSFDPDREDFSEWERDLQVEPPASYSNTVLDAEEEELRAYAEEHACHEDFGDILCEEAFFLSSDDEDRDFGVTSHAGQCLDGAPCVFLDGRGEQGMDIS